MELGCKFRQIHVQQFKTPVDKKGTVCCHFSSLEAEPATQNSRIVAYISLSSRLGDDSKPAYLGLFCIRRPLGVSHKSSCPISPVFLETSRLQGYDLLFSNQQLSECTANQRFVSNVTSELGCIWHIFGKFGSFQALQHWQQPAAAIKLQLTVMLTVT